MFFVGDAVKQRVKETTQSHRMGCILNMHWCNETVIRMDIDISKEVILIFRRELISPDCCITICDSL